MMLFLFYQIPANTFYWCRSFPEVMMTFVSQSQIGFLQLLFYKSWHVNHLSFHGNQYQVWWKQKYLRYIISKIYFTVILQIAPFTNAICL